MSSDPAVAPGSPAWEQMLKKGRGSICRVGDARVVALVPLQHEGAVVAVARIRTSTPFMRWDLEQIIEVSRSTAVRLEASNVFGQVRERAISEERSRLSRQIHDGIAQDLAGLAYLLDATAQTAPPSEARTTLSQGADEVRRLVDELRFSIFDLRTKLQSGERLGTTLSAYAHQVGDHSGLRVFVEVDDGAGDVSADTAHELMRIAQEAITNARRHSRATSLWVALRIHSDGIMLRVSDNGTGITQRTPGRVGSGAGISIMQERAERLRAHFVVRERTGGGTIVECSMGPEAVLQRVHGWHVPSEDGNAHLTRPLVAASTDGFPG